MTDLLCWWGLGGLVALVVLPFRLLREPNPSYYANAVGGIGGFIGSIAVLFALVSYIPTTAAAFNDLFWLCIGAGAIIGGLCAGIWGQIYDKLGMMSVGHGAIGGSLGAGLGASAAYFLGFLAMGG